MDGLRDAISSTDTVMADHEVEKVARAVEEHYEKFFDATQPKDTVLKRADGIIHGDRLQHYGLPHINFTRISTAWTQYLSNKLKGWEFEGEFGEPLIIPGEQITQVDVTQMMVLLKVMRQAEGYHADSVQDTAGYTALAAILEGEDKL